MPLHVPCPHVHFGKERHQNQENEKWKKEVEEEEEDDEKIIIIINTQHRV